MLLRIRSPDGTFRIEVQNEMSGEELAQKIFALIPKPAIEESVKLSNDARPKNDAGYIPLTAVLGRKVGDMGFSHGDMLFLFYEAKEEAAAAAPAAGPSTQSQPQQNYTTAQTLSGKTVQIPNPTNIPDLHQPPIGAQGDKSGSGTISGGPSEGALTKTLEKLGKIKEAGVDEYWRGRDGKIVRGRDEKMCRHGAKGMCDYCMPLEPYNADYQSEKGFKHLSFHSYLRKLQSSNSASQSSANYLPPLTPLNYRVAIPCPSGHAPWPATLCSTCQPSAITLQSQSFRMVDHVEFTSQEAIARFLNNRGRNGVQKFGLLIGRYRPYEQVPMGIKAVVEAVYEPKQEGLKDGVQLGEEFREEMKRVTDVARLCAKDLQIVGMVFSDMDTVEGSSIQQQQFLYKRHAQSFFFSSLETIFAAEMQLLFPTITKSSPTGTFSSRFVSCVATGGKENQLDFLPFQVTEQGVAMVQADMIEASVEPNIVRLKKEDDKSRYIPDVFFTHKNEYNRDVKENAKPCFPVEYLLVNLTQGIPKDPEPLFLSNAFPIENREKHEANPEPSLERVGRAIMKVLPNITQTFAHSLPIDSLDLGERKKLSEFLSDWHLFVFLAGAEVIDEDAMRLLGRVACSHETNDETALEEFMKTEGWNQLVVIASSIEPPNVKQRLQDDGFEAIPEHLMNEMFGGGHHAQPHHAPPPPAAAASAGGATERACPHCTFSNPVSNQDCEICGLPMGG